MDYKDNQGIKNILIFPKSLIKTFLERADGFAHPQDALKVISFVGIWSQFIAKKPQISYMTPFRKVLHFLKVKCGDS